MKIIKNGYHLVTFRTICMNGSHFFVLEYLIDFRFRLNVHTKLVTLISFGSEISGGKKCSLGPYSI